ncbi:MAG: trypsin-like peptidase domain-containing protein [Planctomycetes bacterium]|nr:trypsin-like peptidase domain-containing protein [Planctomycetota bacterium]
MNLIVRLVFGLAFVAVSASLALGEPGPQINLEKKSDIKTLEKQIQKVIADVRKTVVNIRAGGGSGSGTVISEDGWISTAAHVIQFRGGMDVTITLEDNRQYKGKAVGATTQRSMQAGSDYGLIKVETNGDKLPVAPMGVSGDVKPGDWLIAMGHPYGMIPGRGPVVRAGRMIGINQAGMISCDTPLIHGDSGGPIFNLAGEMIAFTSNGDPSKTWANNITPVDGFKAILDRLKAGEVIGPGANEQGGPGVPGLSAEELEQYQEAEQQLLAKNYAEAAKGFGPLADKENAHMNLLYNSACAFSLWSTTLEGEEKEKEAARAVEYLRRSVKAGWVDLDWASKDPDLDCLRERDDYKLFVEELRTAIFKPLFGLEVRETKGGVEVVKVLEKSPAAIVGFEPGDIIKRMGGHEITNAVDYANALATADRSSLTSFDVMRGSETKTISWQADPVNDGPQGGGQGMRNLDAAVKEHGKDKDTLLDLWAGYDTTSLRDAVFKRQARRLCHGGSRGRLSDFQGKRSERRRWSRDRQ